MPQSQRLERGGRESRNVTQPQLFIKSKAILGYMRDPVQKGGEMKKVNSAYERAQLTNEVVIPAGPVTVALLP